MGRLLNLAGTTPPPLAAFRARHPRLEVQLGATEWEYWAGGIGNRGLLLLGDASSFGDSSYHLLEHFEWTRRVLSPSYPALASMGAMADGLVRLMDHEKLETADVFGDALGAGVAQVLVRRHPDRIDRVALASFGQYSRGHAFWARACLQGVRMLPSSMVSGHFESSMRSQTSSLSGSRRLETDALIGDLLARSSKELVVGRLELLADLFNRSRDYHLAEPLDRDGRMLLMLADDDTQFSRREQAGLINAWPGAHVHPFPSGGPRIAITRRGEFDRTLDQFYSDGPARWLRGPRPKEGLVVSPR